MKKRILTLVSILLLISVSCIAGLKAVRAENNVTVNYHISTTTNSAGYTLVVVNMTIKNNGYSYFSPMSYEFNLNESGDNYPPTALTADTYLDSLPDSNLNNGDSCSGAIIFFANPNVNNPQYTLSYSQGSAVQNPNIIWNEVPIASLLTSSASTSTPTSTTNSSPATPEFPTMAILAAFIGLSLVVVTLLTARKPNKSNS